MTERRFCAVFSYYSTYYHVVYIIFLFFLYFIFTIEIHSFALVGVGENQLGRWKNCLWSKRFKMNWRMARIPRHPITTSVSTPEEIKNVFDPISYKKAKSVLRMLITFVTTYLFCSKCPFQNICKPWGIFNMFLYQY